MINLQYILLVVFVLVLPLEELSGQKQEPPVIEVSRDEVVFDRIYFEDEDDNYSVEDIYKDDYGFMWFATKEGLFRYDGREFLSFKRSTTGTRGLSSDLILAIEPGNHNDLWILTKKDISRLDLQSLEFNNYSTPLNSDPSIGNIFRGEIYVDENGIVYAGYWGAGMLVFDPAANEKFHYYRDDDLPAANKTVTSFYTKDEDELWIGTHDGLFIFNKRTKSFRRSGLKYEDANKVSRNQLNSICADHDKNLWIGSNRGLIKYDPLSDELETFTFDFSPIVGFEKNVVESVELSPDGLIYAGTRYGLHVIDPEKGIIRSHYQDINDPGTIQSNYIRRVYRDDRDILWLGHHSGTISKLAPRRKAFTSYRLKSNYTGDLRVFSVFKSGTTIWFGTESGLYSYNKSNGETQRFSHNPDNPYSLSNDFVSGIQKDENGDFWIATDKGGLNHFDVSRGEFENIITGSQDLASYSETDIWYLEMGRNNTLWCGTGGSGLLRININNRTSTSYMNRPGVENSLSGNFIGPVLEDRNGMVWVGTIENGLNYFDPEEDTAMRFIYDPEDSNSLLSNSITSLCLTRKGDLWIATSQGINILDTKNFEVSIFSEEIIAGEVISGLIEDQYGNIWISSNKGLYEYETGEEKLKSYRKSDGLGTSSFIPGCHYIAEDGEILFGSYRGLVSFYPGEIRDNLQPPPVYIIGFYLSGKEMTRNEEFASDFLKRNIKLPYNKNNVSFSFASLDYYDPEKNRFEYKLEGFDNEWIRTQEKTHVDYNNLPPGEYTFRIKASNNDNYWNNEGDSLSLLITPPFWETYLFRIGLLVFILSGIFLFINLRVRSIRKQKEELARLVAIRTGELQHEKENVESKNHALEKQKSAIEMQAIQLAEINKKLEEQQGEIKKQAEELREMNRLKSSFFANISHEFRTPLTLILNSLNELEENGDNKPPRNKAAAIARKNSLRLQRLIDQLLDLTRIESGFMTLNVSPGNMHEFVNSVSDGFMMRAKSLNISYKRNISSCPDECLADWDKLEKILYNLLSNAFKFTPSGGEVEVSTWLKKSEGLFIISVKDNGPGIAKEIQHKIFSRFYREEAGEAEKVPGTGIGLALVKQLVHIYRGKVELISEPGTGSEFIVSVPLDRKHFSEEEISDKHGWDGDQIKNIISLTESVSEKIDNEDISKEKLPVLLFVDDNLELCKLVNDQFSGTFKVYTANDGREGFEKAMEISPDIIVSDVMMPVMTGTEFCEKIKKDARTDYIPFILLTAKNTEETEMEGFALGADDFMSKPFSIQSLKLKTRNLYETRRNTEHKLAHDYLSHQSMKIESTNKNSFLDKVIGIVLDNLEDPEFNVNSLARELFISRTQLYRKFSQLTSIPVNDFIKDIRLKKAHQFLMTGEFNINEVATKCGFNTPGYFSKCFEEKYGVLPSRMRLERRQ